MGEHKSRLIQNYEDARLALLLYEYAEIYGKVSTEQYKEDLAAGKIEEISEQELDAKLNAIIQRAEAEELTKGQDYAHLKRILRKAANVAASVAIFFFLLVSVQAAGIDILGAVGKWTNSLFHFESGIVSVEQPKDKQPSPVATIKGMLLTYQLPPELAPAWLPDEFSISEINYCTNKDTRFADVLLINDADDWIMIRVDCFSLEQSADNLWHQKDNGDIETIEIGQFTFYLAQNNGVWEAMEYDGGYAISIIDTQGKDALIQILQKYGG